MKIVEVFRSIQGEGKWLGTDVIFIRLPGCNLKCPFCDTDWSNTKEMSYEDLNIELHKYPTTSHVVITGGEPTVNSEFRTLCYFLRHKGYYVHVETNGTRHIPYNLVDWITVSPKADSDYKCEVINPSEIKLVVTPDFNYQDERIQNLKEKGCAIWLQPEGSQMKEMWKKAYDIVMKDPYFRVGVQLHKLIEVQ